MGISIPGYALLVSGIFFLGGIQLSIMGLVGEYIARIYRQSQQRPLYICQEKSPSLPISYNGWYDSPVDAVQSRGSGSDIHGGADG